MEELPKRSPNIQTTSFDSSRDIAHQSGEETRKYDSNNHDDDRDHGCERGCNRERDRDRGLKDDDDDDDDNNNDVDKNNVGIDHDHDYRNLATEV